MLNFINSVSVMPIINIAIIAAIVAGAIVGFTRRTANSLVRLITVAAASLLTVIFTPAFSDMIGELIKNGHFISIEIPNAVKTEAMTSFSDAFYDFIGATIGAVIIFVILLVAARILCSFVCLILRISKSGGSFLSRIGGAVLGCVTAVIICGTVLMPFFGIYSYAEPALDISDSADNYIGIKLVSDVGFSSVGNKLVANASEYTIGTDKCSITDDIKSAAEIYSAIKKSGIDSDSVYDYISDTELMVQLGKSADGSRVIHDFVFSYVDGFLTQTLGNGLTEFSEDETFMSRAHIDVETLSVENECKYIVPLIIEIKENGILDGESIDLALIINNKELMNDFESAAEHSPIVSALLPYLDSAAEK